MVATEQRPLLVVEDSDEDFAILERLMQQQPDVHPEEVYRCSNGDDALDFLYRTGDYTKPNCAPRPATILLDLNLPGTDGRDVLKQLKQDRDLQTIPIVVFTTSDNPADVDYCYRSGANGYLVKPVDLKALRRTVKAFVQYWLQENLPNGSSDRV